MLAYRFYLLHLFLVLCVGTLFSADQEESFIALNHEIGEARKNLQDHYKLMQSRYDTIDPQSFKQLSCELERLRKELSSKEELWKKNTAQDFKNEEAYAFWDQQEITIGQLIAEYGSCDFLYVMTPDVASLKLHVHTSMPVPKESWSTLLELIFSHNGVGIRQLNPYTRELYLFKQDMTACQNMTTSIDQLLLLPSHERVIHLLSPKPDQFKQAYFFIDRFRDTKKTFLYQVGQRIVLVGTQEDVRRILQLHETIWDETSDKIAKVIALQKIHPEEATKLLSAFFGGLGEVAKSSVPKGGHDLMAIALPQENSIILVGSNNVVDKATELLYETQDQVQDPQEVTVEWYQCRHSDPIDLADVLERVYESMTGAKVTLSNGRESASHHSDSKKQENTQIDVDVDIKEEAPTPNYNIFEGYNFYDSPKVVNPPVATLGRISNQIRKSSSRHFIPYPKTGAVLMVVKREMLNKLKDLISRLDVPKKMIQIEVLLCEKRVRNTSSSGLNLLKLGSAASGIRSGGAAFDMNPSDSVAGLFKFFFSRPKSDAFPAFDFAYHFLLSQDDMRVNATPSILTINQTPATISVVDEISINNGAAPVNTNQGIAFEKSYSRAQFGITLVITPTVHEPDKDNPESDLMVSLHTDVGFDTIKSDKEDRPDVHRRHVENHVCIPNGQTVILGGLLRKVTDQRSEKIPFLGEIPGIGKLFGDLRATDQEVEMFIFITPKVMTDPLSDLQKARCQQLMRRPGDCPEFLMRIAEAKACRKQKLFEQSIKMITGYDCDACFCH